MQIFQWMHIAKLFMEENYTNAVLVLLMEKYKFYIFYINIFWKVKKNSVIINEIIKQLLNNNICGY